MYGSANSYAPPPGAIDDIVYRDRCGVRRSSGKGQRRRNRYSSDGGGGSSVDQFPENADRLAISSSAHSTQVFKRLVGETPGGWHRRQEVPLAQREHAHSTMFSRFCADRGDILC